MITDIKIHPAMVVIIILAVLSIVGLEYYKFYKIDENRRANEQTLNEMREFKKAIYQDKVVWIPTRAMVKVEAGGKVKTVDAKIGPVMIDIVFPDIEEFQTGLPVKDDDITLHGLVLEYPQGKIELPGVEPYMQIYYGSK